MPIPLRYPKNATLTKLIELVDIKTGYIIYSILVIIVLWLVLKTDVVFNHEDLKNRIKSFAKK